MCRQVTDGMQDGAFYLEGENRAAASWGLTENVTAAQVTRRCGELLSLARAALPFTATEHRTPLLLGLPDLQPLPRDQQVGKQ